MEECRYIPTNTLASSGEERQGINVGGFNALIPTVRWPARSGLYHQSLLEPPGLNSLLRIGFTVYPLFTSFALLKSPTYDYSARGLGIREHYQHALGRDIPSPTIYIIIGLKEH